MASSEELSGLNTNYDEPKKGSPCLTIYELYQVEQYEAQELFEFEQYIKIIRFAEAVCSGTHPRFGVFPQSETGAHMTGAEASMEVDVEFKNSRFEELKAPTGLNFMPKADKKTREKGYAEQSIINAEDLHGARYIHDPVMDYYEMLSLDSSASIEDIKKAYSELRRIHDSESDEGKTKWRGKEPTISQDMKQNWNNIERAFMILSDHERKWSYDIDRELRLKGFERKNKKPDESLAQIQFAAFREEVVRSIGAPHSDDPPEPYNEDFFKSVTKGIVVEEKDINYDINYYHDLGANDTKKSSSWNGVISRHHLGSLLRSMGHDYIRNLRQAKNQKAMDKVRSEWNQKLISYMILKDEKLRRKYNEHNHSYKFYEHLQKEHDSKELERVHNSLVLVSEKIELRGKSFSFQQATTGYSFRKLSTETNDVFMKGVSDDGASASDTLTRVEQNTEIDYSVAITSSEKLGDRVQVNPHTITDRLPKLMSQAFSISKVPLQNKLINQNAELLTGSLKSSTLQRKLLQTREIQAQRVVQEKKAPSKLSVQATERSAKFSKEARTQHPAVQDQVPKILPDQQAFVQKQLNAQRAAVQSAALHRAEIQRSLGLDRAPPTGPRIPLGMAPRLMISSFAHSLNSTSPSKSCTQLGLKIIPPPMINKFAEITGSTLQLSKGSKQGPAKKKRRVRDKESDGKKEIRNVGNRDGSGSGVDVTLQDRGRVKEDRGEKSSLKEDGEILEDERGGETGRRQSGNNGVGRDSSGKKRKREHRKDS
ncbi:uncharacterized protein EAE98_012350 [Botrytis deweyae]|uniref:J domain-containing protein n=1 Tax=Botrytis deweyae TaxID=2478750 RepID=A0ABQ7I3B5_9HELO|nr:uncharacterized protein EAE98_012350 [Botrytis deweyae]KAF7909045.1 hypothetical protein EAE98_012350 [Botrytis deweyae]